jgi:hypothetical protein
MRQFRNVCLAIALLFPAVLYAGQIYGTIVLDGKGVPNATIEIACDGKVTTNGVTAADGSYRVNVRQEGQCTLALPKYAGRPSAVIFSSPNPSAYHFELVRRPDGNYELRRR